MGDVIIRLRVSKPLPKLGDGKAGYDPWKSYSEPAPLVPPVPHRGLLGSRRRAFRVDGVSGVGEGQVLVGERLLHYLELDFSSGFPGSLDLSRSFVRRAAHVPDAQHAWGVSRTTLPGK